METSFLKSKLLPFVFVSHLKWNMAAESLRRTKLNPIEVRKQTIEKLNAQDAG